jgi:hypothetical protein
VTTGGDKPGAGGQFQPAKFLQMSIIPEREKPVKQQLPGL